ncbi:sulfur carrier protein ThiS [Shewanella subflava]|uniref:Sulfur carrier protein ThiS n=1 Tax=Shewanella subflava TaxID=2986476 RepID=A0ABT3I7D8_9GAMM|nr:sulfur carrier protein ThiS [Shewanella subflava]MCW3171955.1 sulfur carrier protein ThiS [Shewanella subflava]
MITIHINGELQQLADNQTLAELLVCKQVAPQSVAVVVNQAIIPRSEWSQYQCQADDQIEFFSAVAGG